MKKAFALGGAILAIVSMSSCGISRYNGSQCPKFSQSSQIPLFQVGLYEEKNAYRTLLAVYDTVKHANVRTTVYYTFEGVGRLKLIQDTTKITKKVSGL